MKIDKTSSERLSVLRFPLIVGVVFIHAYSTEVGFSNGAVGTIDSGYLVGFMRDLISQGLARLAVPLFFLLSGYFFFLNFYPSVENYIKKIKSRTNSLLIPFLFWNILTLLLIALAQYLPATQSFFSGKNEPIITFGIYEYINAIFGIDRSPISYQFWFIRDLMVMVLFTPVISLILNKIPRLFLLVILVLWFFNFWPIYIPSVAAFLFFYSGAYFAHRKVSMFTLDRFGILLMLSYSCVLLIDTFTKGDMVNSYIHNIGILLGIASMLFATRGIVGVNRAKRYLLWAGNCSFFVFAVHEPLLTVVKKVSYKILVPSSDVAILLLYFLIPTIVIFTSIFLYMGMRNITPKFLSLVCGGR